VLKSFGVAALALLLASCGAPRSRQSPPQNPVTPSAGPRPPAGVAYRIDSGQSELRVLVYRAGPLARLGHNHVIVNRSLQGRIDFAGTVATSSFSMTVPVAGFVVDDDESRREEGPDFPEGVPVNDISGTLHNMQSDAVLDAARYPAITVRSVGVTEVPGGLSATLAVSVAGHGSTIVVPFTVEVAAGRISALGTFELRQSSIGLTPFSVMLGALQVQDEMRLKLRIIAVAD
jgi:polyisoprenoid-binding protein YceI